METGTLLSDIVIRSQHSRNRYDTEEDVFLQLLLMDAGVKKDIWSVMEDFSKAPGVKDLNKMKGQYEMFVYVVGSKQVTV